MSQLLINAQLAGRSKDHICFALFVSTVRREPSSGSHRFEANQCHRNSGYVGREGRFGKAWFLSSICEESGLREASGDMFTA